MLIIIFFKEPLLVKLAPHFIASILTRISPGFLDRFLWEIEPQHQRLKKKPTSIVIIDANTQ